VEALAKVLLKVASSPATLAIVVFGFLGVCALALGAIYVGTQTDKTVEVSLSGIHIKADKELLEALSRADRCEVERDDIAVQASKIAALLGEP